MLVLLRSTASAFLLHNILPIYSASTLRRQLVAFALATSRKGVSEVEDERTYCERCNENFDDEGFDYRFDYPVCLGCAEKYCVGCHKGDSEPATHQLIPQGAKCCVCAECPNLTCAD